MLGLLPSIYKIICLKMRKLRTPKRKVKSSMKLQNVFRRVSQVSRGASDTVDGDEKEKKVGDMNFWNLQIPNRAFWKLRTPNEKLVNLLHPECALF